MYFRFTVNGLNRDFSIHKLVAEYFIPNPNQYDCVDHIDGNTFNNHVENLRWVNRSQNNQNRAIQKNNKTGIIGVNYFERYGYWQARWVENRKVMTKSFKVKEEAVEYRNQMVGLHYSKEHLR
jgi:hypothetical protein